MANFLENVDLAGDSLDIALVLDPVLFQYLDGYFFASYRMRANPDLSKRSRAQ